MPSQDVHFVAGTIIIVEYARACASALDTVTYPVTHRPQHWAQHCEVQMGKRCVRRQQLGAK
jgi:hypothetical protein